LQTDLLLVGGGLANSLIAFRCLGFNPETSLVMIERQASLGADHTWSFHDSDLSADQRAWMEPLVAHAWPRHELRFPRRRRCGKTDETRQRYAKPNFKRKNTKPRADKPSKPPSPNS